MKHPLPEYLNKMEPQKNASRTSWVTLEQRTVLQDSGLPLSFWGEALNYCTATKNRRPCYSNPDNIYPYTSRYDTIPDYKRMKPFGQACTVMHPKKKTPGKKLGVQTMKGLMVGYER